MKVAVVHNAPPQGRSLVASVDISAGETLFEEEPLVSAQFLWNTQYKYHACDHCMRALETAEATCKRLANQPALLLPHPECCEVNMESHVTCPQCMVSYCSAECRDKAWHIYHKTLCLGAAVEDSSHPLNRLAEAWRNIHYPPETCSIMLLARMVAMVKQSSDRESLLSTLNHFCKATVNEEQQIAHKLLGGEFQRPLEMLRTLSMEALYDDCVQQVNHNVLVFDTPSEDSISINDATLNPYRQFCLFACYIAQWFTPDGFSSVFALIGTNGQGIGTSSLSVWVRNCENLELSEERKEELDRVIDCIYDDIDKVAGEFLNCEGSGLYHLQSACNHSCEPNAEVTFAHDNFTLTMKAIHDIKAGQEVFISYLDECVLERSRYSRQKILRDHYLFHCQCTKCESQADEPDVTSDEEMDDDDDED